MHTCEVGWNRGPATPTVSQVHFYSLGGLMLDIKRICTDFDTIAQKLATRGVDAVTLDKMKEFDSKRRELLVKVENLKAERNTVSAEIAQAKRNKENADDKIAAMQKLSAEIKALDAELAEIDATLTEFTTTLPNIPHDSVPVGADEDDNVEVRRWGTPRVANFSATASKSVRIRLISNIRTPL